MNHSILSLSILTGLLFILNLSTTPTQAQLIAYWPLDESSGTIAHDKVWENDPSINLDGRFKGLPVWDPDGGRIINGVQSGAIYLHPNDRIEVPQADEIYDPILDFNRTGDPMSLTCWIKTDGVGWPRSYAHIVSKGYAYRLYASGTSGEIRWFKPPGGIWIPYGGPYVNDTEWHHLCGTYDGSGKAELYVDGEKVTSFSNVNGPYNTSYWFTIGQNSYYDGVVNSTNYSNLEGWIDDVSVWGQVLTPIQINELMDNGALGVNIPPVVDAGPPQVNHLPDDSGGYIQFQLNGDVSDNTVFGANTINWHWSKLDGPGSVIFEPHANAIDPIVKINTTGLYTLILSASDGVYEANDTVDLQVYPDSWTGEVIRYSFENNLEDTSTGGAILDHLTAYGYMGIREDDDLPETFEIELLDLPFEPGIEGQAIRLSEILLNEPDHEWLYNQSNVSGTMLQADTTFDTSLSGYGTFTIEAYIKPDPGINFLGRLIYVAQVDYDRGWTTATDADDGNIDTFYLVYDGDPEPYEFGGNFYQSNGRAIGMRYGARNLGYHEYWTPPGQWHHVAATGDGQYITIWVNGFGVYREPYDGTINVKLDADNGLRISSFFTNRNYTGLIDEVVVTLFARDDNYFKNQALQIPLHLFSPHNQYQYAPINQIFRWASIKGPFPNTQYEVYFGQDAENLPLMTTTTGLFYLPTLDYDTEYHWYIKPIPQGAPSEIRSFKTAPPGFDPLLAHWKLDEGKGGIITDSAPGSNFNGVILGAGDPNFVPGWITPDRQFAAHFAGADDNYIEIINSADPDTFKDLARNSYSIALWIKADQQGFTNDSAHFITLGDFYGLSRFENSDHARFYAAGIADLQGTSNINDSQWHHLVAIYNPITLNASLYVDGSLEASADFPPTAIHTAEIAPLLIASNHLHPDQPFNGALDDIRIYRHHALTDPEIQTLFEMGFAHKRPTVNAGDNQILTPPAPYTTSLAGSVTNDGLPPGDSLTIAWTQTDGPTTAVITPTNTLNPSISNLAPGVYNFVLTADDDAYRPFDEVKVWVQTSLDIDKELLYLRFEEDIDSDSFVLTVPNEPAFGFPFVHILPDSHPTNPDYLARLDPNVPLDPIPLTAAANQFSLGRPLQSVRIEGTVEIYPQLTYAEEITVEFFAEIADEDNLTIINFLDEDQLPHRGFKIYHPRALKVQYYIASDLPNRTESIELTSNINLSDYTTGSGINEQYHAVGWKHVAWTYDKTTGISRILENGIPAYITHVNSVAQPGELFYDGPDQRGLIMPNMLDSQNNPTLLTFAAGVDAEPGSLFDEIRITAEPLLPDRFLIVAQHYCTEILPADINGDCFVNLLDYIYLANQWLKNTNPYTN